MERNIKMKKTLILYRSKYGATKQYAEMLQEALSCDLQLSKDATLTLMQEYDTIVFAGAIYAGGIAGLSVLRKNYAHIKDKKILIFCVGASPYDEKDFEAIKKHNLKSDLKDIPVFYGRGAWDMDSMHLLDRTMCKCLRKSIAKKDPATYEPWMKALMEAQGQACNWVDKSYLQPLLAEISKVS